MINREQYLKDIIDLLTVLVKNVEIYNSVSFFDINSISEDFYVDFLNLVFGYKLVNLNRDIRNAPAVDLIDVENRIAIQITSDNSNKKISETIDKFIEYGLYAKYERLIIFILVKKKKYKQNFGVNDKFEFNSNEDIIDYLDIIKTIKTKNIGELKIIKDFLDFELRKDISNNSNSESNEIETIISLIEEITNSKKITNKIETVIDPEFKINKRFVEFSERVVSEYTTLYSLYNNAIQIVNETLEIDEAQEILIILYLQDISVKILDQTDDDPVDALKLLVDYFEKKLSSKCKRYDRGAIKFYLINEMIKCNVFPNERSKYDENK